MISIIVCSIDSKLLAEFSNSVITTIGVPYEILSIDNLIFEYSIFEAYNYGVSISKFENLVFVHEDVIFHTKDWGKILLNYFNTLPDPGVMGVAGSSYLPISPSDWWVSDSKYLHTNLLSNSKNGTVGQGDLMRNGQQVPTGVFALDGMFLALRKSVWKEFSFDESLPGFHGYDTDICYQVTKKYRNYFIPGILLEHFSKGYPNLIWLRNTVYANRKILPFIHQMKIQNGFDSKLEIKAFHLFLGQLKKFGHSRFENIRLSILYFNHLKSIGLFWKLLPLLLKYLFVFTFTIPFKSRNLNLQWR